MADYTIKKGDTFYGIDRRNDDFTLDQLLAANPGVDPKKLQIGQSINFPKMETSDPLNLMPKPVSLRSRLIPMIEEGEGFKNRGYLDTRGNITIGFGSTRNPRMDKYLQSQGINPNEVFSVKGTPITREMAQTMRDIELNRNEEMIKRALPFYERQPDNIKLVLQDMVYNMGLGNYEKRSGLLGFRNMNAALKAGDVATAARELMASNYGTSETRNRALRNRRLMLGENQ